MTDIAFYTTLYGKLDSKTLKFYRNSLVSFTKNNSYPYYILATDEISQEDLYQLTNGLPVTVLNVSHLLDEKLFYCSTYKFSFRYFPSILQLIPFSKLVSVDLDLFYNFPFPMYNIEWSRINAAQDLVFNIYPEWFNKHLKQFPVPFKFYINAGLIAFSKDTHIEFLTSMQSYSTQIAKGLEKETQFHDQDWVSYYLNEHPGWFNPLSARWNWTSVTETPEKEIPLLTNFNGEDGKGIYVYHITKKYQNDRLDLMSRLSKEKDLSSIPQAYSTNTDNKKAGFTVMVICKNQVEYIPAMVQSIRKSLPGAPILYVLDRDSSAIKRLTTLNVPYLYKEHGSYFDAGGTREFGLSHLKNENVLCLDGDRIPTGLSWDIVQKALASFDFTLIRVEGDFRNWFSQDFSINPWIYEESSTFYKEKAPFDNHFFTCGFIARGSSIEKLRQTYGHVFSPVFSKRYGNEDLFLGDSVLACGMTVGGAPSSACLKGYFAPRDQEGAYDNWINHVKHMVLLYDRGYKTSFSEVKPYLDQDQLSSISSSKNFQYYLEKTPIKKVESTYTFVVHCDSEKPYILSTLAKCLENLSYASLISNIFVVGNAIEDVTQENMVVTRCPANKAHAEACSLVQRLSKEKDGLFIFIKAPSDGNYFDVITRDWFLNSMEDIQLLLRVYDVVGTQYSTSLGHFINNSWVSTSTYISSLENPSPNTLLSTWVTNKGQGLCLGLKRADQTSKWIYSL